MQGAAQRLSPLRSGSIRFLFIGSQVLRRVDFPALRAWGAEWRLSTSLRSALRVESQRLVFEGRSNCGETFAIEAPIGQLEFHGRRNWFRNGLLPWLRLPSDSGDYFLCVETGPLIFGAGGKTRKLLSVLKQQAEQGGAEPPACRRESDSEGCDEPQPESEEPSQ